MDISRTPMPFADPCFSQSQTRENTLIPAMERFMPAGTVLNGILCISYGIAYLK